jgi:hypothetical protein
MTVMTAILAVFSDQNTYCPSAVLSSGTYIFRVFTILAAGLQFQQLIFI